MATDFTEEGAADAVIESFARHAGRAAARRILDSLVRHLHAAVREVEPSLAEWEQAIEFLTATGQKCDDVRQEFILLSDVLGISMLVETINERGAAGATQSTVLGPFHMTRSPSPGARRQHRPGRREPAVRGHAAGWCGGRHPAAGRDPRCVAGQRPWRLRRAGAGRAARRQRPRPVHHGRRGPVLVPHDRAQLLPDPDRRPGRRLLAATRRHPYRPAHIHFIVAAPTATAR